MPKRTLSKVETVVYNGITFRRYPESKRASDRNYFKPNSVHVRKGVEHLHREIWKAERGAIPDGYHVHHKDQDTANNSIDNLECIPQIEHIRIHNELMSDEHKDMLRARMDVIRPLTKEWHASPEGIEWHKQHAIDAGFGKFDPVEKSCDQCGKTYDAATTRTRFCSNNCKSAYRRTSGVDNETRQCARCGKDFTCNKYSPVTCCSGSCGAHWRQRR